MVLHTIIDMNDIFFEEQSVESRPLCKNMQGVFIEGAQSENGMKISRVISTNPNDYLSEKYSLGHYIVI